MCHTRECQKNAVIDRHRPLCESNAKNGIDLTVAEVQRRAA